MRFSESFIVFLGVALILLIVGNITSLVYFAPRYFNEYVQDVRKLNTGDDSGLINAFIESKDLDPATIEEYRLTLQDLRDVTKSLESYSLSQKTEGNSAQSALDQKTVLVNSLQSILKNIVSVAVSSTSTPERVFLLKILSMLFYVNAALISLILAITFGWTRIIFRPTKALSDRLARLTETREYVPIRYTRKDEFAPLVKAVNTLSESLAAQEKIRSDFLSDFSHEIKTPITALKVFLEAVEDGVVSLDEKGLAIVQSELDRLLSTTDSIMQYERVVALKERQTNKTQFNLVDLFSDLREEYLPTLARNSQMIRFDETAFHVVLERDLIIQMTHNIFSNFTKYSGSGTTLSIRMSQRARKVTIHFEDDGRGVLKTNVAYLREKFYQEDSSRSGGKTSRWIGIGLSLIEKIAKHHNGHISISSDRDKGFRLKVVLEQAEAMA